ncbi:MAG: hypothetical protein ACJ8AO_20285 [Gemmatimonadaceae bacterium]
MICFASLHELRRGIAAGRLRSTDHVFVGADELRGANGDLRRDLERELRDVGARLHLLPLAPRICVVSAEEMDEGVRPSGD